MKTLIASDIHSNIDVLMAICKKVQEEQIEVLVLGGDIISGSHPKLQQEPSPITMGFLEIFSELLSQLEIPIYITPGNHDTYPFGLWRGKNHISVVVDDWVNIGNSKIYMTPWSLKFNDWSWMQDDEFLDYKIPDFVNVLVSHGPLFGYYDIVDKEHVGSKALLRAVQESAITKVFTGHIHGFFGDKEKMILTNNQGNEVIVKNISMLDEDYKPKNNFIIEDL